MHEVIKPEIQYKASGAEHASSNRACWCGHAYGTKLKLYKIGVTVSPAERRKDPANSSVVWRQFVKPQKDRRGAIAHSRMNRGLSESALRALRANTSYPPRS